LHAQHLGQKFMGEWQGVLVHPVVHTQDPTAASGFHRMNRIAGHNLEELAQKRFAKAADGLLDVRPYGLGLVEREA
jgi:hypothetical protein